MTVWILILTISSQPGARPREVILSQHESQVDCINALLERIEQDRRSQYVLTCRAQNR